MPATTTQARKRGSNFTKDQHRVRAELARRSTDEFFARDPVLGGTLLRVGPEYWRWRDGVAESRVSELSVGEWGLALGPDRGSPRVEIRRAVLELVPSLRWVVDGWRAGTLQAGATVASERPRPAAHAVPCTVAWPGATPRASGCAWLDRSDPVPASILVPLARWNSWIAATPAAAAWDSAHDADILGRAWALGWRPEPGYVSPAGWVSPCPGSASERDLEVGMARLWRALQARFGTDGCAVVWGGEPAHSGRAQARRLRLVGVPAAAAAAAKAEAGELARRILGARAAMCIVEVCPLASTADGQELTANRTPMDNRCPSRLPAFPL